MRYRMEADTAAGQRLVGSWKKDAEAASRGWLQWWRLKQVIDIWLVGEDGSRKLIAGGLPKPPACGWAAEIERACREADEAEGLPRT